MTKRRCCNRCSTPLSAGYKAKECEACLADHVKRQTKYRLRTWQQRVAKGVCVDCGEPCKINPKTTKPFVRCPLHAEEQNRKKRERRAAVGALSRKSGK